MSSVKNLFVIVMLMGVSYGAFQVINAPDPFMQDGDETAESLELETMPRIDGDPVMTDPVSTPNSSASLNTVPKLPPMSSDELAVPELEMPELEMAAPQPLKDPQALSGQPMPALPPNVEAPPRTGGGFDVPNLVPPSSDPVEQQSGGGQFAAQPQTNMQPITPPAMTEQAMSQAQNLAQPTADSLEQAANQFIAQGQQALDNQVMEPARGSGQLLDNAAVDMTNRADQLVEAVQGQYEQAMTDAAGQFAPSAAAAVTPPETTPISSPSTAIDWPGINQLASSGQPRMALANLSAHYNDQLPQDQRMQMLEWLDLLAGKVIYSTEHHLQTRPYVVADGDTLESLAARWQVPAQLIYNVNNSKIGDPSNLIAGTELKVIEGPFNATVNIERQEMTLFLSGMYAGRFPIELGEDGGGIEHGEFVVQQKQAGKDYVDPSGQTIVAGANENPYGRFWIELAGNLGIHEANPQGGELDRRGSIRLGSRDAGDVFGILSQGSQVTITR